MKKKIWASFNKIIELFSQKFVTNLAKNMDLGSGILDPGSGKKHIPDPGPGVKKASDPGSGFVTLERAV
jgi:hypothetical protein